MQKYRRLSTFMLCARISAILPSSGSKHEMDEVFSNGCFAFAIYLNGYALRSIFVIIFASTLNEKLLRKGYVAPLLVENRVAHPRGFLG